MALRLRKANASDASALTDIYFSAFSVDAISQLILPRSHPSSYTFWQDSILEEIDDPNAHFICVYDSSIPSNPVVSYAKWVSPSAPIASDLPTWPPGSDANVANHFFGEMFREHAEIMGERKHWYLEILATRPECQGKGAGGQLLRWGIAKADQDGVETYTEASPDGKPIYERFGFEEKGRLVVDLEGKGEGILAEKEFVEVFMLRGIKGKGLQVTN